MISSGSRDCRPLNPKHVLARTGTLGPRYMNLLHAHQGQLETTKVADAGGRTCIMSNH